MKKKTANRLYRLVAMVIFCCAAEAGALWSASRLLDQKKLTIAMQQAVIETLASDIKREHGQFKEMRDYSWKLESILRKMKRHCQ